MSQPNEQFFEAYLAGTLSSDDKIALAEKFDANPTWREAFLRHIEEAHDIAVVARECRKRKRIHRRIHPLSGLAAAAAVALTAGSLFMLIPRDRSQPAAPPSTVGRVISGSLMLPDHAKPVALGGLVPAGVGRAMGETVMIKFDSGSAVALFDGAEVELIDPSTLRLRRGRLTGRTGGEAQELTVIAATRRITDLGTRFGVEHQSTGATEVHVLQGSVKVSETEDRVMAENQALRFVAGTPPQPITVDRNRFAVSFPGLDPDPSPFVHYAFEDANAGIILDSGSGFDDGPFPFFLRDKSGRPRSVPGPFGRALALTSSDVLNSDFPGIAGNQARTVAFWVKPAIEKRTMAVVSWGRIGHGRKWQVALQYHHPSRQLLPRTEFGGGWVIGSGNLADGEWHHVVSVYLGGNDGPVDHLIRHYIDGEPTPALMCEPRPIDTEVSSPDASDLVAGHHQDRPAEFSFQGQLDEVYVFDRALSPVEIRQLYQHNSLTPETSR